MESHAICPCFISLWVCPFPSFLHLDARCGVCVGDVFHPSHSHSLSRVYHRMTWLQQTHEWSAVGCVLSIKKHRLIALFCLFACASFTSFRVSLILHWRVSVHTHTHTVAFVIKADGAYLYFRCYEIHRTHITTHRAKSGRKRESFYGFIVG